MTKKLFCTVMAMAIIVPTVTQAEQCEPSRWTVTLEMLEPLSDDERQAILEVLGMPMDPDLLDQAIQENAVPLETFGGE